MTTPVRPARLSPEQRTEFDYLLNAFEQASQHAEPATVGYAQKRQALFAYVRGLENRPSLAALASTAPTPTPTWQDIASAPKDVTVLVWVTFHESYGYTNRRDGMIRAQLNGTQWSPMEATGQYWHGMTPHFWQPSPASRRHHQRHR
jgi:hypothetical protein